MICRVMHVHKLSLGTRPDQLRAAGGLPGDGDVRYPGKDVRASEILFLDRGSFPLSTQGFQIQAYQNGYDFRRLEARLLPLNFRIFFCTRTPESLATAREEGLIVSGNPSQYNDLSPFIPDQELGMSNPVDCIRLINRVCLLLPADGNSSVAVQLPNIA